MSEEKVKTESYNNLGGINAKVSPYLTGPQEFLDLQNFDFTRPGSLTKSPGTVDFLGVSNLSGYPSLSGPIAGLFEFNPIGSYSQQTLTGQGVGLAVSGRAVWALQSTTVTPPFTTYIPTAFPYPSLAIVPFNSSYWSFSALVNRAFFCNGGNFFKWHGAVSAGPPTLFSLPYGITGSVGVTAVWTGSGGMSGAYVVGYGYFNDRGYFGPAGPINGLSIMVNGASFDSILIYGMTHPLVSIPDAHAQFGVSGIALYCTLPGLEDQFRATLIPISSASFILDNGSAGAGKLSAIPNPPYIHFTMSPRYLEVFNNSLMMSGFSSQLSTVWFSEVGEPEGIEPTFSFEVRTNDGDKLYGQKSYQGGCIFFKERSLHKLTGDNPDNYFLQEITDQYGCISHRAAVVWQDKLWFLDKKGICEYNGANTQIVSNKMEPIFLSMNIDAAREQAEAIHNRLRNEVWFSIPINGATLNNCTVVYDYVAQGWSTFRGFQPSSLAMMRQTFLDHRAFFGDYSGHIYSFDETVTSYNGQAMTCVIASRFFGDQGRSVQTQFRRLFLDVDPVPGGVSAITFNFFQDYGSSIILTRQMGQQSFQSRIDFGISAKSMAFKMYHSSASLSIRVNGWTTEGRTQRMV